MKAVLFASSPASDIKADLAFINNLGATTAPDANADSNSGYQVGSLWVDTDAPAAYYCVDATPGAAVWVGAGEAVPGVVAAPDASTPTGAGGAALVEGGAGGSTSGAGGAATLKGGDATAGNSNGGGALIQGGAGQGSGIEGAAIIRSVLLVEQGAPIAKTVSVTLTAVEIRSGIITVDQGAAGPSELTLPLATAMDTAFPLAAAGDAFDFSVINISTVTAEIATVLTAAGWTLVGGMDVLANEAGAKSSGRFRARKTGTGAWTLYRLS